jgi:hypothetical protein
MGCQQPEPQPYAARGWNLLRPFQVTDDVVRYAGRDHEYHLPGRHGRERTSW